ncbi:putative nucleoside-diphosphate-sugar epimerase [Talaromyces proteolyticus]|uniref:Nucleoside-diphosphate-sugar epimerase n=1 Tax=Talaromyces proteolyticus TaxID=1131652 RepID=A0AAD4PUH4_9EURO|nr:putative nucleoside-diphosphate-sugar epimerase [Talaromyces proteolyticus]KAH8689402.1 putative nucleoside-diphosphate-sugar epimerase [Talaromyces proteolyticus]
MAPSVFITGITGYVGGDFLFLVTKEHPDWDITALIRDKTKAKQVTDVYPAVRIVLGDLESTSLIIEEVEKADIVYNFADCDHGDSARAIAQGGELHTPERPLWLIHTSGTGVLTFPDFADGVFGIARERTWNDWDGVDEITTTIPDESPHRLVDKIILEVGTRCSDRVKTAIVCPPLIYGTGRGPGNTRSMQAYWMAELVVRRQKGFVVGKGENKIGYIHVHDLVDLFLSLGQAATGIAPGGSNAPSWGAKGYYFTENGSIQGLRMSSLVAEIAYDMGLIPSTELDYLTDDQALRLHPKALYSWGTNQRFVALRARRLLGWSPYRPSLEEAFSQIVASEAAKLA